MDARNDYLLRFVRGVSQFVIPIYQRKYSWEYKHCEQLWNDIILAGEDERPGGHFIGSIVYVADNAIHDSPLLVIDGQQRLTTLTLLIAALHEVMSEDEQEPFEGFSRKKLKNYYLVHPDEAGKRSRRLILSETDRDTLFAIIDGRGLPDNYSRRIVSNFRFFRTCIATSGDIIKTVCCGLSKLLVVHIALSRERDNAQLVFESMNSKGLDLSQSDLIRNYMLMGLEPSLQEHLYNSYWRPMEQAFGQEAYNRHFDGFMRHYLTFKTDKIPRLREIYEAFKYFARKEKKNMEELVQEIHQFSKYYCAIALRQEIDQDLKTAFNDLVELRVDVAYPLLLELYSDYDNDILSREDFMGAVRLIESYVFRRAVCDIPTNSLNKTFATFGNALEKHRYLESMMEIFRSQPFYRRFPSDKEFEEGIKQRNLYYFRSQSYWLRRLENFKRKERVPLGDYTVEHIMPQTLTNQWKRALGKEWERIHEEYLHTLGNITLTGYNSEYSNKPFRYKRDTEGGFKQSPLRMNKGLGKLNGWSEHEIKKRANRLAKKAIQVWIYPTS